MRVLVQRVHSASCTIDDQVTGAIDEGLLLLVGVTHDDTEPEAKLLAGKVLNLRIFNDPDGKIVISLADLTALIQTPVSRDGLLDRCDRLHKTRSRSSVDSEERPDAAKTEELGERIIALARRLGIQG